MALARAAFTHAPPATRYLNRTEPFKMRRGGVLPGLSLAYETWGHLNVERTNAVLLFTGLSPSAHAASSTEDPSPGWWEYMIGPGRPIDTRRLFVVCVNSLGSCFGSTGPASANPATGGPYRLNFPELTVEDIAAAGHLVVRALGIQRLCAVAGASLGGMSALAYAALFPRGVEHLLVISAAAGASAFAIAIRSLQREIICSDPCWEGGYYQLDRQPLMGMRMARKLGLISYRSAQEWQERFGRLELRRRGEQPFGMLYEVESYLDYNARKFIGGFDANCYLYLSRSMDLFDLAAHGGSVQAAFAPSDLRRALVIGVTSDVLFPAHQQQELAGALRSAGREVEFTELASINGHDSFLIDRERFAPVVKGFFSGL